MRLLSALTVLAFALVAMPASAQTPCVGGDAGGYPCDAVDLMSHLPLSTFATTGSSAPSAGNDIWGWTDPVTGNEYALMGTTNGTAFVDITDPANPIFLGKLPTNTSSSSWRDIKTIGDFAYIVSEAGSHGMQIFDLTRLRTVSSPPATFTADAVYTGFGSAHNVVVLEEENLAIGVGASSCSGGLHFVDVTNPRMPVNAGCFSADGYTHDAQCLIYSGPDTDHTGTPICVASNEDTVTVVDVSNRAAPVQLSRTFYPNPSYTHQGWFTEDQRWFVVNDEIDEINNGFATRTIVMDMADLDAPDFSFFHAGTTNASDHNLYIKGDRIFQSNYRAGLQILDATTIASGSLSQVAFFDTFPSSNAVGTSGQWSNYPYFESGIVIASDISNGLFVLAPQPPQDPPVASITPGSIDETVAPGGTGSASVTVANGAGGGDLLYSAELQNLSQPFARPDAAQPAPLVFADAAPEADALTQGRPSGDDPALTADAPSRRDDGDQGVGSLGSGGPDAFGYAWIDSDETGGPTVGYEDISGTGTPVSWTTTGSFPGGDEGYDEVTLPFSFPFYGDAKTSVRIFSNGFLTFSTFAANSFTNQAIPASGTPNDLIAPFWDDLDQSAGGSVHYGTLTDGRFAVQYTGVPRYSDTGSSLTFQVILAPDGTIEYQYGTMTAA
ncbi:MAG: hypothetical protein CMM85_14490, partial [Rhodothermaceae bacterium]|nr:hypothetical protein [Rhodothermaceae bacterium]